MKNEDKFVKVRELAEELGMTISNLNIQIGRGHAGEVKKIGEGETKDYELTLDNVFQILKWLRLYGRGSKRKLILAKRKYEELRDNE